MQKRKLGLNGPEVSEIGYGAMGVSIAYGNSDEAEGIETLQRRIQRKVTVQSAQALHKDEYEIITR